MRHSKPGGAQKVKFLRASAREGLIKLTPLLEPAPRISIKLLVERWVIGEHAQEDVGAHAFGGPMADRADVEIDGLQAAEGALDIP